MVGFTIISGFGSEYKELYFLDYNREPKEYKTLDGGAIFNYQYKFSNELVIYKSKAARPISLRNCIPDHCTF